MLTFVVATALAATTVAPPGCDAAPIEDRLPSVIAPMAGHDPVWIVGQPRWSDEWDKSVLVLARKALGPLTARARLVDGSAIAHFRHDDATVDVLSISDPARRSVTPGGASADIMRSYAFIMMSVQYPARGCWEFSVTLGPETVRIIRDLRE
jgi:hypothetical protein